MPVHFAGLAADMKPIGAIARKHGLNVIDDAAHTLPSTYGGKLIGSLESDAVSFELSEAYSQPGTKTRHTRRSRKMSSKRVIDFLISGLVLLISAPPLALLSVLVIWDSGFPVFFRQERLGKTSSRFGF